MNASTADRRREFALRAFPPRWRERHGDELLYVSSELASSTGQDGEWRELVDIVRGGLTIRIDDRPPLRVRAAYRWFERPVPQRWHAWMRDDLASRSLGYRRSLRVMLPLGLFIGLSKAIAGWPWPHLLGFWGAYFAMQVLMGPFQARRLRKRMNALAGYDIIASDSLSTPVPNTLALRSVPLAPPIRSVPATRVPFVCYALPFAVWLSAAGIALVAGAAISNTPDRSIGPVSFSPDANSPLTPHQVALIAMIAICVALTIAIATDFVVRRRVRSFAPSTAHESGTLSTRVAWFVTTIIGLPVTTLGALGVMPDLACALFGAVLVISGAVLGMTVRVVARRDAELGRHISLAELLVGERVPAANIIR